MTVELRKYAMKVLQGDMMTPISVYQSLRGQHKMLFESSAKHEESGRYSFIAVDPVAELKGTNDAYTFLKGQEKEKSNGNVLDYLKKVMPFHEETYPFHFFGGVIGFFGYETAFYAEKIGEYLQDELAMPDVHVFFYDTFIVFDHVTQEITLASIDLFREGRSLEEMEAAISTMEQQLYKGTTFDAMKVDSLDFKPMISKERFVSLVERAKQHILKGDIFQIVLSQRFSASFTGSPFALYRQLRTSNPSPYMFYMDYGSYIILGTSPESLVKVKNRQVTTNPIAGTKPRGKTMEQDEAIANALLEDEKEVAEHRMLVDLGRNDLGRIANVGSVKLKKFMNIERYKYVMHIVSEVLADLRDDLHVLDVLRACLPAGTVSGAPKIRAMQLINELEPVKRGVYAGAVGYISTTGDMDLALAIRTMIIKDEKAHVQAGAGIVHDSVPLSEYEETLNKARALLEVKK
ncbi:anthranilate synthase component I [Lysinibacillus fusiformis]|uniref:anthranilate synthase component I n=1 Tax=Lysinibacillus fusiformis TaxID=28031 RepID=UPI00215B5C90|nr:anthranilate synthase component I [Lysinibacillus fusiformis]MCR8853165.1 anthranilate synthase component I [Lysinibacillus fusiformis]WKT75333.1 anthranilate synthase component I [Lysinibacillus fusiformis]